MARVPQVTRTFKTTKATVKAVDLEGDKMISMEFVLPRTYKDDNAVLKAIAKIHHNDNIKIVKVMDTQVEENLYAMSEETFLANATIVKKSDE